MRKINKLKYSFLGWKGPWQLRGLFLSLLFLLTGMRDPTQPPESVLKGSHGKAISTSPMELSAIFIYPSYRLAIINGQTYQEGEKIGEYVINTIYKDTVELKSARDAILVLPLTATVKQVRDN